MDSRSLAIEMAPLIMWQKGDSGEELHLHFRYGLKGGPRSADVASKADDFDYLGTYTILSPLNMHDSMVVFMFTWV